MGVIVRDNGSRDFDPAPEGLFAAICVDVVDKGIVNGPFGPAHKVQLRWQIDGHSDAGVREDGRQWLVVRQFTASLHPKAALRAFLVSWRGKQFTDEELVGFDLDNIVLAPCMVQIIHNKQDSGKVFANVQNIMPLPKGMPKPVAFDYVRVADRGTPDALPDYEPDDDVMPF